MRGVVNSASYGNRRPDDPRRGEWYSVKDAAEPACSSYDIDVPGGSSGSRVVDIVEIAVEEIKAATAYVYILVLGAKAAGKTRRKLKNAIVVREAINLTTAASRSDERIELPRGGIDQRRIVDPCTRRGARGQVARRAVNRT